MSTNLATFKRKSYPLPIKAIAFLLCFILAFEQSGFTQVVEELDISNTIGNFLNAFPAVPLNSPQLRYISYDKLDQSLKVIANRANTGKKDSAELLESLRQPLRYFYTGLTIPNKDFWVNLGLDSPNEVIDDYLIDTDLGKILMEADLELKKDLARATFPSTPEGKEYWNKIYDKIEEAYGCNLENAQISINTKIWITPGEIVVCEDKNSAYVYKARLNVSTETAYLSNRQESKIEDEQSRMINEYSSELIRELILPKISKEVNTGKKYVSLRQAYYSLILAQWFKRKFYDTGGLYPYLIDQRNLTGLTSSKQCSKDTYFKEYQKSYLEKEYDLQVQVFNLFGRSIRTYSSGGVDFTGIFNAADPARINVISASSFSPPSTGQEISFKVQGQTLQDPYFDQGIPIPPIQNTIAPPSIEQKKEMSENEINNVLESLESSSTKYIQRLLNSKRIDTKERIRFIANELSFDILNGKGISLLVRNPETLRKNKEFLRSLGLPVNIANLKSSKRSFIIKELEQITKYPRWGQLNNEEKLSVVSYLFHVYKLESSQITKDEDWDKLLKRFDLKHTSINYSPQSIDFIQQHELAKFRKNGNILLITNRISKIKEIVETSGLKITGILDTTKTQEEQDLFNNCADKDTIDAAPTAQQQVENEVSESRLKELQSNQSPQAPPTANTKPQEHLDHTGENHLGIKQTAAPAPVFENNTAVTNPVDTRESEENLELFRLKELEAIMDADITPEQIHMVLNSLANYNYTADHYKAARQIARHIKPTDFLELKRISDTIEPFASNKNLRHILDLIALERPTELNVGISRSFARIHDWEEMLKRKNLTETDITELTEYCEKIYHVLPLHLTQETGDTLGTIYKRINSVHYLIQKTINCLIEQKVQNKAKYAESVEGLLKWGHYFSDYLGALGCLSALNIAKGYIVDIEKANGNSNNGNGKTNYKIKYSLWHKITAVPYIAWSATKNLNELIDRINTTGNRHSPEEYYKLLTPTRIGPATSWVTRKHISLVISFFLTAVNLNINIFNGFNFWAAVNTIIGFLITPLIHYAFAMIGNYSTRKDLKKLHRSIAILKKRWDAYKQDERVNNYSIIEEHPASEEIIVTVQDIEMIVSFADSLGIKPVKIPKISGELTNLFGPEKFNKLVFMIIPEAQMFTQERLKINSPVKLGNTIFIGDEYLENSDFKTILADIAYEQIAHLSINSETKSEPGSTEIEDKANTTDKPLDDNLEEEISEINRLIRSGIIPSSERIKECLKKTTTSDQKDYLDQLNNCLAAIFMLEEKYSQPCNTEFVNTLRSVISNK
ncbi:MAG: hypothetical protein PHO40_03060 [Candidatus Omnitrophica bacterium]|nr:hypothetical protein [Candidatus Omnitrophota bacterium]